MKQPPVPAERSNQTNHGSRSRGRKSGTDDNVRALKNRRRVGAVLSLLLVFTLVQLLNTGAVGWPLMQLHTVTGALQDYATRPGAGWRKAADVLEEWGATREGEPQPAADLTGRVVRIADGDTVSILDAANRQHKVRLYGIDTPERDQPFGKAASNALKQLLAEKPVDVVIIATDNYGREVGTLYQQGVNINLAMVTGGYAWWYQHYAPHERKLEVAEQQARKQGLGLWSAPHPVPPWDWRRGRR